jgi:hypothetical protein
MTNSMRLEALVQRLFVCTLLRSLASWHGTTPKLYVKGSYSRNSSTTWRAGTLRVGTWQVPVAHEEDGLPRLECDAVVDEFHACERVEAADVLEGVLQQRGVLSGQQVVELRKLLDCSQRLVLGVAAKCSERAER